MVRGGGEDRDRHRRHQRGIIIVADHSDGAGGSSSSGADAFQSSRLLDVALGSIREDFGTF